MAVLRYSESIQKQIGSKTKPEPWLHITTARTGKDGKQAWYAIFVWDTRQVVEEGKLDWKYKKNESYKIKPGEDGFLNGRYAQDNGKPLVGAKHDFDFTNESEITVRQFKISQLVAVTKHIYDTYRAGIKVSMKINGHFISLMLSPDFTYTIQGVSCNDIIVDNKKYQLIRAGSDMHSFRAYALSIGQSDLTAVKTGKSQHFVGQTYSCKNLPKIVANDLISIVKGRPEDVSRGFLKAVDAI